MTTSPTSLAFSRDEALLLAKIRHLTGAATTATIRALLHAYANGEFTPDGLPKVTRGALDKVVLPEAVISRIDGRYGPHV